MPAILSRALTLLCSLAVLLLLWAALAGLFDSRALPGPAKVFHVLLAAVASGMRTKSS